MSHKQSKDVSQNDSNKLDEEFGDKMPQSTEYDCDSVVNVYDSNIGFNMYERQLVLYQPCAPDDDGLFCGMHNFDVAEDSGFTITGQDGSDGESNLQIFSLTANFISPQESNFVLKHLHYTTLYEYQFSGTYYRYPSFATFFKTFVDSDANLTPQMKFAALLKLTLGIPHQMILGLLPSEPGFYEEAKHLLEKRYNRPILLQFSLIEEFFTSQSKIQNKNRMFRLLRLRFDLERIYKYFLQLKPANEWWQKLLKASIRFLPQDVRNELKSQTSEITCKTLLEFLDQAIKDRETLSFLESERRKDRERNRDQERHRDKEQRNRDQERYREQNQRSRDHDQRSRDQERFRERLFQNSNYHSLPPPPNLSWDYHKRDHKK